MSEGGKVASLAVIAGAAVGASIVGAALFFLFVSKQKKSKASNITEKVVIEVDGISARKQSGNFDDNLLEEGRKASVNRFIFSTHRIEDDGTCGFSESNVTNNSSFRNATENIPSTKSDNENEVSASSIHDDQINYVNPNFTFKINDDSESSVGPDGDEVDDKGDSAVELFPIHSFSAIPNVPASSTEYVSNEMGIQDCIRENGTNSELIGSTNDGLNFPYDKDDDSDSFEEVEIGSDDELEENLGAETGESSQKKSDDFHESFSIEEYEDASDEEIEISVHDDVEDEAILEIECEGTSENVVLDDREPPVEAEKNLVGSKFEVESRSKLPELSIDVEENSQNATDTESDDDSVDMKKEVEVAESDDDEESESEEEVEEEFESESEEESESNDDEVEVEAESDDDVEGSESDDESQISETTEHEDLSANSDGAEAMTTSYQKYRPVIEELIRQVMPDEIDNIDVMMEQFIGNEKELVTSLRNMAGIDDSEATGTDADDKSIAIVEKSTSEEEESDDDEAESEEEESDSSEEEGEESDASEEEDSDEEEEESESSEEKSKGESQSASEESDDDDSSEYESD